NMKITRKEMMTQVRSGLAVGLVLAGVAVLPAADTPMWGGTPGRNMVNVNETGIVSEWDVNTGHNVKWKNDLGSQAYGNPVIYKGKVFVGTNNGAQRDPA